MSPLILGATFAFLALAFIVTLLLGESRYRDVMRDDRYDVFDDEEQQ